MDATETTAVPEATSTTEAPEVTATEGQTATETTQPEVEAAETTETPEKPDVKLPDESKKQIARMARALERLQKENADLKVGKGSEKSTPDEPKAAKSDRSSDTSKPITLGDLKSREDDDGDKEYIVHGMWVTEEHAKAHVEQTNALADSTSRLSKLEAALERREATETEREAKAADADYQKKEDDARAGIDQTIGAAVVELRKTVFPDVTDRQAALLDKNLSSNTHETLTELVKESVESDTFTLDKLPELVQEAVSRAFADELELRGHYGKVQFEKNEQYRKENPVKPGGTPGSPQAKMPTTSAERDKMARQTAERLMAGLGA